MKIETKLLQELVAKSVKGASNNRMLPITMMIGIEVKDNLITLVTTNGVNYFYVSDTVETDDFYAVVEVAKFAKLVGKTTTLNITLDLTENSMVFKGNGKYEIDLPLDENGKPVTFPAPKDDVEWGLSPVTVKLSDIQTVVQINKSSLSTTFETACYTGYYINDKVYSSNGYVICCLDRDLGISDEPVLLNPDMVDLVSLMEDEAITLYKVDNKLLFEIPSITVYGVELNGIEEFNIQEIGPLTDIDFDETVTLDVQGLLSILDRLMLFVSPYDKNSINLTFTSDHLEITSKSSSAVETIEYEDDSKHNEFMAIIDIVMLQTQLKSMATENVDIGYGLDNAIKLSTDDTVKILALSEGE